MGNIRTALLAWLQARLAGGRFILRMDDLDQPRVVAGSAEQILDDLRWLGIDWDEGPDVGGPHAPYVQSGRIDHYNRAFDHLQARALIYPCYCSRKDIREAASAPHEPGHVLKYLGTCRPCESMNEGVKTTEKLNKPAAWRFQVNDKPVYINDCVFGDFEQNLANEVGDFVIKRRDGLFAYQLATVVDDLEMGVSDVLRGIDLLDSAPRQVTIFEALGGPAPHFWHVPLMCDDKGQRLSKRDGADSLFALRQAGASAEQIIAELAADLCLIQTDKISANELLNELKAGF